jgi:hypothetical protein
MEEAPDAYLHLITPDQREAIQVFITACWDYRRHCEAEQAKANYEDMMTERSEKYRW